MVVLDLKVGRLGTFATILTLTISAPKILSHLSFLVEAM